MHHPPEVAHLGLQPLLLLLSPLALALEEASAIQGHRHSRGQGIQEAPVRIVEGGGDLEDDAAEPAVLQEQRQRVQRRSPRIAAGGHEVRLPGAALQDLQVGGRHLEPSRATRCALESAEHLEGSGARPLDYGHAPRLQRLEKPRREALGQLRGIGGGGDHRDRVHEQPHVAIVLVLVAGIDALEAIDAARVLDVGPSLPDPHPPHVVVAAGRAQRLVRAPDHLLGVDGLRAVRHRQPGAELQAQDPAVVPLLVQPADQVLADGAAHVGLRVEEDDGEGRPAVPRHVVTAAEAGPERGGDLGQDEIAGAAVQALVDPAEVVRAEEDQHRVQLPLHRVRERQVQLRLELRPLGEPRDLVEERPGDRPRMRGEGGGHAQEVLPPAVVAEGVGSGGEMQQAVVPAAPRRRVEAQAGPGRQLHAGTPVPLAAVRTRAVLLGQHPAQRDAVENPVALAAGQPHRSLVGLPVHVAVAVVQLRGRGLVRQLGEGAFASFVKQDLALAASARGNVQGHRSRPAEAFYQANIGPEDVGRFAHRTPAVHGQQLREPGTWPRRIVRYAAGTVNGRPWFAPRLRRREGVSSWRSWEKSKPLARAGIQRTGSSTPQTGTASARRCSTRRSRIPFRRAIPLRAGRIRRRILSMLMTDGPKRRLDLPPSGVYLRSSVRQEIPERTCGAAGRARGADTRAHPELI